MTENSSEIAGFVDAHNLAEALATLRDQGPDVTVLAGGTDVMVQYLRGDIHPRTLLNVRRLSELKGLELGSRTVLGALTTHWQLANDAGLRTAWSDKHPAYEIVSGPSGKGLDELYAPEINSTTAPGGGVWTDNPAFTRQ